MHYAASQGSVFAYDYNAGAYKDIGLGANNLFVKASNGYVGIGTTSPITPLHVSGSSAQTTLNSYAWLAYPGGSGTASGFTNRQFSMITSSGIWVQSSEVDVLSDVRTKTNIGPINTDVVNRFMSCSPIEFQYKDATHRKHLGYSAQELMAQGLHEIVGVGPSDEELPEQDIECFDGSMYHLGSKDKLCVNIIETIPLLHRALQMTQIRLAEQDLELEKLRWTIENNSRLITELREVAELGGTDITSTPRTEQRECSKIVVNYVCLPLAIFKF
jgi:hypothetical protein